MFRDVETICPFCGVGCRIVLRVDRGRVVGLYPAENGINEGKLCIKGWSAHEFIHHPKRLTAPLLREKRSGTFRTVTWDAALSHIRENLSAALDAGGPAAVGVLGSAKCTNEDNYVLQKFARAVVGTPHIDHCARLCHASTLTGLSETFGSGAMTNSIEELEKADVMFVIGSNTTEQHPLIGRRILRAMRDGVARLIVADPRRTDMARCAHVHLAHRPGTDTALINGMLRVIVDEALADDEFITGRTEGFEAFLGSLREYSPERVADITGVSPEMIVAAARMYGTAEKASIIYAMGITQHVAGTANVRALANLALATGNVGKPSTGVNPLRGQNNVQGACDMGVLPSHYPGYQPVEDDGNRDRFSRDWRTDRLPQQAGLTLCEMMDAALDGRTRFLWIMGENPALSDPDTAHVRRALEAADFLIVQDIFPSETTAFAHVVLPGASYAEKEGTFTSTERRVQRVRAAIEPVGSARPEWAVIAELARLMGYDGMNWRSAEAVFEEIARVVPQYRGMSYLRLGGDGLQWPCPDAAHPGTPFLHEHTFSRGKGRFIPVEHVPPPEQPDEEYPLVLTTGRSLFQFHTGTMTRRSPILKERLDESYGEVNPADAVRAGIEDGDPVVIRSRRGEIVTTARVTETVPEGTVFVPIHFAEAAANMLTLRELDPLSKIPELKVCAVSLKKRTRSQGEA
ncbi:MAG: formate dehydrogenase subunit alpha [Deltaproteobacteria bacterium]|nr:formate dehydrogenase subunit alpha [Deltaproteobacteria bacterium]